MRISIQYATYSSFRKTKVLETKIRQALVSKPGGCTGHLRGYPFLGGRHALRRGWVRLDAAMVSKAGAFLVDGGLGTSFSKRGTSNSLRRTYNDSSLYS